MGYDSRPVQYLDRVHTHSYFTYSALQSNGISFLRRLHTITHVYLFPPLPPYVVPLPYSIRLSIRLVIDSFHVPK